jgi:arginine exporter protein ArgO
MSFVSMSFVSMFFIPDPATLLTYSVACFILFITPGPDMSLFLAKTVQGGRRAGIASLSGAALGCLVHSLAAAFGVSALIAASAVAFNVLKVVGALYLLWMAYSAADNRVYYAENYVQEDRSDSFDALMEYTGISRSPTKCVFEEVGLFEKTRSRLLREWSERGLRAINTTFLSDLDY